MKVTLEILRQARGETQSRLQRIAWETADDNATVATALADMNRQPALVDLDGQAVGRIEWECSCLQKKCGACAMRINGIPRLACDTKLAPLAGRPVRLEPLKKFPVVADLIVDRAALFDNLKAMKAWLDREVGLNARATDTAYEASRCLQCGCCLEVRPNFMPGGAFSGTAAMVPASRLIVELSPSKREEIYKLYTRRVYNGCGKSLACRDICPAGIDVEGLLVNSNAIAVWKRTSGKRDR